MISLTDYHFDLPKTLIAQFPTQPRDSARMLVVHRDSKQLEHRIFSNLPQYLHPTDCLVLNETKVFPARLFGKKQTGGTVELLLLRQIGPTRWTALSKPGLREGAVVNFENGVRAIVTATASEDSDLAVEFHCPSQEMTAVVAELGKTPTPPYIQSPLSEERLREEYQTVYAKTAGSAAAPTAGMHFTPELLATVQAMGISLLKLTLHVGPGTFQRLRPEQLTGERLHEEYFSISEDVANALRAAKKAQRRIIAVGTTTTRALESAAHAHGIQSGEQKTDIFIHPPYQFKLVDGLITNFHLPESSLLMLVAAFTTQPMTTDSFTTFKDSFIGSAYQEAIDQNYRFFSFGDAMLIL